MRVMHVIGAFAAGGAERFVVSLAPELVARGMQIELFVLSNRRDKVGDAMSAELAQAGIPAGCGPTRRVGVRSVYALAQALRRSRPQIIHMHTPNTELAIALARCIARSDAVLTRTIHSTEHPHGAAYRWARRRNRSPVSVACSHAVSASDTGFAGPIEVIENGVKFAWPLQSESEQLQARRRLTLNGKGRHFLAVGRMGGDTLASAPKAHDILIQAWQVAGGERRGDCLHLVGDGSLRPELERLAAGDPTIRFWGVNANIGDWLLAADVFVMPSRFEGLPIAAIEAVGTGLPCIFSDIAPLRQLEPPVAAWVPVNDTAALAAAFAAYGADLPRVPHLAAATARGRFSIASTADRYTRLYSRLIDSRDG